MKHGLTRQLGGWAGGLVLAGLVLARAPLANAGTTPDGAAATPVETSSSASGASVGASVLKSKVKTTERVVFTMQIDAPKGWKPDSVSLDGSLPEGWNVLTTRPAKVGAPAGPDASAGMERTTLVFELEPFLPGTVEIKPVKVVLRPAVRPVTAPPGGGGASAAAKPVDASNGAKGDGAPAADALPITLSTAPIQVEVVSVLPEGATGTDMAEIKGVVEARTPTRWWLIGTVSAGVVATIALAWWLVARSHRLALTRVVTRPAHEIALERLNTLLGKGLLTPGRERFKAFFDEASAILREYIEDRFHLHAPERTTEEFLRDARGSAALSDNDVDALGRFLNQCDLIKFARHTPHVDDGERAAGIVREFIVKTKAPEATVIIEGPGAVTPRLLIEREAA